MKNNVFTKALGLTLVAGIASGAFLAPAKKVSADSIYTENEVTKEDHSILLKDDEPHVDGEVIISTKGVDLTKDTSSLKFDVLSVKKLDLDWDDNLYIVSYKTDSLSAMDLSKSYDEDLFNYMEYNYYSFLVEPFVGHQPQYGTGLEVHGYQHTYMDTAGAFKIVNATSHKKVRVAVIDMGVDYTHPELEKLVNLKLSYDVRNDQELKPIGVGDHGTHVAGIIGARNNGSSDECRGVAANAKNDICEVVSFNVFNCQETRGGASHADIAKAINMAVARKCQVINMSLGGPYPDNTFANALRHANSKGLTIVCSAGNDRSMIPNYPASYNECINVIATGAYTDPTAYKGDPAYSNYGILCDISAPGTNVYSSVPGGGFEEFTGTSMAAPCVTGVVTLMLAVNPKLTPAKVRSILSTTAVDLYNHGRDIWTGYGMVDAAEAVAAAKQAGTSSVDNVDTFITRVYDSALDSIPDAEGYDFWYNKLANGSSASEFIASIFSSARIEEMEYTDAQYIAALYASIFDRAASASETSYWMDYLTEGYSRQGLLCQFLNSAEFKAICDANGLVAGEVAFENEADRNPQVTKFVDRLYAICMDRTSDEDGEAFWCKSLNDGTVSGQQIVSFFFTSKEYKDLNKNNDEFINDLYEAFFGREADAEGYAFWADFLANGGDRDLAVSGFVYAAEFQALCEAFGVRQF